jgi:ATP-dependent Clp protease ATP-binding subunit ClpC
VNFKNTIIIMTSNAGTRDVRATSRVGFAKATEVSTYDAMKTKVMDELKRIFNPEFLNRVDETIVFHPLTKKEIAQIVDIQFGEIEQRLKERSIKLQLSNAAKAFLIDKGYDPVLGARPLRRTIQRHIEDQLAEEFLHERFHDGDTIAIEASDDSLVFNKAKRTKKAKEAPSQEKTVLSEAAKRDETS